MIFPTFVHHLLHCYKNSRRGVILVEVVVNLYMTDLLQLDNTVTRYALRSFKIIHNKYGLRIWPNWYLASGET